MRGRGQAALVTAERALASRYVGAYLRELAVEYGQDERLSILLYLVFERLAGAASELAPWLALWPTAFSTPVYYDGAQWSALAGTQLYLAAKSKLSALLTEYDALRADAERGLADTGLDLGAFTLDLWIWADAVYRTRVCEGPFHAAPDAGAADTDAAAAAGSSSAARMPNDRHVAALIPLVDFANHGGSAANARWVVDHANAGVHLVTNRPLRCVAGAGAVVLLPRTARGRRSCCPFRPLSLPPR